KEPLERTVMWNDNTLRSGKWKMMLPQKGIKETLLFDLSEDPSETRNLAEDFPAVVELLTADLLDMANDARAKATKQPTKALE
ncbi:MAG TPA: Cerebroside-sulfatase, partial [Planctomycetaceae bacterium]|nr:Cerebroside-sulfatase [Planctomycetaceae bacterium]